MAPGQETSLTPLCSNLMSLGSKCAVLKKCLWHCCDFLVTSSDLAPGEFCSLAPLVTSLVLFNQTRKIFRKYKIFKSERDELLFHEHLQFSNIIRHGSCTDCQERLPAFHVFSCSFCVITMPCPMRFFRRGPVLVFLIIKLFQRSASYFFEVG